ncbi:class I SAM-dependent methyltransferase [Fluviispira multicolorata]|uniref:class I SAM-dependent methyltransferase n=1 Tax=Fluviispira multicolorata TaxID=2654512 RepID=UPI001B86690B|nr:class I SAM-dependent methyltransferase [Fluviispira multicolorata]
MLQQHYDASAENYHLQYERNLLSDVNRAYPANYFRLQLLLNSFLRNNVKRVIEVGVGEGTPLVTLTKGGIDVAGFDISESMVSKCKYNFKKNNLDESKIMWGDIQDPITYASLLKDGQFDALLAMGVTPHVRNDEFVLKNMRDMVRPGGRVFIEFRNKLFSLFTFNKYTYEFIMDDLLRGVSPKIKKIVEMDLKKRLEMDKPPARLIGESAHLIDESVNDNVPGYDAILSKFHNPFEVLDLFKICGFVDTQLLWYHFHPAMPYLNEQNKELFRDEALKLEHDTTGWRGLFLCSAFVVEAVKPK